MADTVELMRKRVLEMAIRGMLVEQHVEEGNADTLLIGIKQEKDRLIKDKKIKKEKEFPRLNKKDYPFEIPSTWTWSYLNEVCLSITDGSHNPPKGIEDDNGYKMLSAVNIEDKVNFDKPSRFISEEDFLKEDRRTKIKKNDVLLTIVGTIGRSAVVETEEKFTLQRSVAVLKPKIDSYYMKYMLQSSYSLATMLENAKGTAQLGIYLTKLRKLKYPIPPLAEQKRIVEKIEEIFAIIDQIGTKKEEALSIIRNMRQTALQDAIMGVLVEQDENDEPASVLYEKIQAEKEKLVKEKKIKKNKPLPEIETDKVPFEIPDKWKWVRLSDIGSIIGGGTPKTSVDAYWEGGTIPWVSPADLTGYKERTISEGRKNITELGLSKSSARLMPAGTVLFSSRAPIGYVAIAENPISTNQGFKSVVPYVMDMNHYIYYYFFAFIDDIKSRSSGTTFKEISGSELGKSFFPMPPLAEQQRIVEKLDEIMAICDQMEAIFDGSSETKKVLKVAE